MDDDTMKTELYFDTTSFTNATGRTPSGKAMWAFEAVVGGIKSLFLTPGSTKFSDAKKLAKAHFAPLATGSLLRITVCH